MATIVEAPMVGKILKIEKNPGDHVDEDEVIIVMEAMKMEIPIVAPVTGTLKELKGYGRSSRRSRASARRHRVTHTHQPSGFGFSLSRRILHG